MKHDQKEKEILHWRADWKFKAKKMAEFLRELGNNEPKSLKISILIKYGVKIKLFR